MGNEPGETVKGGRKWSFHGSSVGFLHGLVTFTMDNNESSDRILLDHPV